MRGGPPQAPELSPSQQARERLRKKAEEQKNEAIQGGVEREQFQGPKAIPPAASCTSQTQSDPGREASPKEPRAESNSNARGGSRVTEGGAGDRAAPSQSAHAPPPTIPAAPTRAAPSEAAPTMPAPGRAPAWTRRLSDADADAVRRAVVAVRQSESAAPDADAAAVVELARALSSPAGVVAEQLVLVAAWARTAPDAARPLRGVGWAEGQDRSRSLSTLTRLDRWADRLAAARAWDAAGRPTTPATSAAPSAPSHRSGPRGSGLIGRLLGPVTTTTIDIQEVPCRQIAV